MARARNAVGSILALVGVGLLVFSMFWYFLGVRRLAVFPSGFDHTVTCEGTATMLTGKHGLLSLSPAREESLTLNRRLSSLDADYRPSMAVVEETVKNMGRDPFGLNLAERNVYVLTRRDCQNLKSNQSTSNGVVVDRTGSWYANFPIGTKKESRNLFNNDVASAFAVNFEKKSEVNGVGVYTFRGSHGYRPMVDYEVKAMGLPTETTFGELKAELAEGGISIDAMVRVSYGSLAAEERRTLAEFPDNRNIKLDYGMKIEWEVAVEPVTGTIVKVYECRSRIFVNTDVRTFLPLLEILANHSEDPLVSRHLSQVEQQKLLEPRERYRIAYGWSDYSVREMTDFAGKRVGPLRFIKDYMMSVMLLLGAAFFITGLVIRRKEHRREKAQEEGPQQQNDPAAAAGEETEGEKEDST